MDDVFASRLRALMAERGLGVLALARRVPCDKAQVSRVANGKQRPSATLAGRLDEALGAGGELAALAAAHDGGAGDEYVAWAQRHPRRVDEGVIVSLESVLA